MFSFEDFDPKKEVKKVKMEIESSRTYFKDLLKET